MPGRLRQLAAIDAWRAPALDRRAWWELADWLDAHDTGRRRAALKRDVLGARLLALPHLDDALADAERLAARDGELWLGERRATLPDDIASLARSGRIDLRDAITALRDEGLSTLGDMALAARDARLAGDMARAEQRMQWLAAMADGRASRSLAHGVSVIDRLQDALALRWHDAPRIEPLGSLRRFEPVINDIDLLVESEAPADTLRRVLSNLGVGESHLLTPTHAMFADGDRQVSLRAAGRDDAPALRLCLTGSAAHLAALDNRAHERGLALGSRGLVRRDTGERLGAANEAAIYAACGLSFVEPERRHGLPDDFDDDTTRDRLVDIADIRGDLHTHTIWSDGRDAVDAIVYAARALGYEYVAITDHSGRAKAPRTLTRDRIARQADDIARVRALVPEVNVLHGIEVDIMADGSLDFPDEVLEQFDIVLASLHEREGQPPAQLLHRYERAMRHPRVHVITHPANRLPGHDPGYDLDFDTFFRIARETGTVVEVDGGPHHLDLDGLLAKRAVAAGVRLSIDSDCHHAARLGRQMRLGVGTARRGAIRPRHVVNTLGYDALREWLAVKRPHYGA